MHYQFNVKVVHTLTHLILPGHPTLPFEGFRGKYSVGQAHTYPCGQVYDFDRREGVARPESKHQIIITVIQYNEIDSQIRRQWHHGRKGTALRGRREMERFTVLILGNFFPNRRSPSIWESAYGPAITTTTRHWWSAGQRRTQSEDGPEFILAIICMDTAYSLMLARGKP